MDEAFGKRLTTVVAGAGYGKSTLVAAWASDVTTAWHTVTPQDAALSTFHRALAKAIAGRVPDFPAELTTASALDSDAEGDETGRGEILGGLLAEALADALSEDLMLVVDDAHVLPRDSSSAHLLEALCRQSPETLHLILVSREEPPFPIARLRGQGQVLELSGADLTFDEVEVGDLVRRTLTDETAAIASSVHALTRGWPAAVRMAVERLRLIPAAEREAALGDMRRPHGPLFTYLAEEVFGRESEAVRELLVVAAEFAEFSAALGEALGIADAATLLEGLERRGLLVVAADDESGWFTVHELVRDFVHQQWGHGSDAQPDLHLRAAAWFTDHGLARKALRSLRIAADPDSMLSFLRDHGRAALAAGAAGELAEIARELPVILDDPEIAQCLGEAFIATGDLADGRAQFLRAAGTATQLDPRLARLLAETYYMDGDGPRALEVLARASIDGTRPVDESLLLSLSSNAHGVHGEIDRARELAEQAHELALRAGDDRALAHAYHAIGLVAQLSGERGSDAESYRMAIGFAERSGDVALMGRSRSNLAAGLTADGRIREALENVNLALHDAELHGSVHDPIPTLLTNRGEAFVALGRFDEAIASFEQVTRYYDVRGKSFAGGHVRGLADAYRERGDIALARETYERSIALAEPLGNVAEAPAAHSGLALTVALEDPARAQELAERALVEDTGFYEVGVRVDSGWVALAAGNRAAAAEHAEQAERAARRRQYRAELATCLELRALVDDDREKSRVALEDAASLWTTLGNDFRAARAQLVLSRMSHGPAARSVERRAERQLRSAGVRIEAAARAAGLLASLPPRAAAPISIQTLGAFLLLRHGRPVPVAEWQSKKARDLLKLLVARAGRPVPRDLLMEALWPGAERATVSNRLSVALSTVRAVLDPERILPSDHYVSADTDAVSLSNVEIDVMAFLESAETGLASDDPARLEDAEALYAGEFLEEDLYQDWTAPLREEARAAYIRVARALAEASEARGGHDAAARYLRRVLERDAFDERAHIALAGALQSAGQHGEARRAYQKYAQRMAEIGVEAAPYPSRTR